MVAVAPVLVERNVELAGGISGTLARPAGAQAVPCVVLLHGFGGHRDEVGGLFAMLTARLAERGIASFRFDFPGCGKSEGDFADTTIGLYAGAAGAALRHAEEAVAGRPGALGLLGFSFGGAVATACLGVAPIRSLVLWAPVGNPAVDMIESIGAARAAEAERTGSVGLDWGGRDIRLNRAFFASLSAIAPVEAIADFEGSLLVAAGSRDRLAKYVERIAAAAQRARRCDHFVLEGADHFFDVGDAAAPHAPALLARTADFLADTLGAA